MSRLGMEDGEPIECEAAVPQRRDCVWKANNELSRLC